MEATFEVTLLEVQEGVPEGISEWIYVEIPEKLPLEKIFKKNPI